MSTTILAFILFDLVVSVGVVLWILRRRQARASRAPHEVARALSTAEVLAAARGEGMSGSSDDDIAARIAFLAGQSSRIDPAVAATIARAVRDGQSIDAIKAVRTATGLGLKEAKDVVDRLALELRQ